MATYEGKVASATTAIFTVAANKREYVTSCRFVNVTGAAKTLHVTVTKSGGTERHIAPPMSIDALGALIEDFRGPLEAGDKLSAYDGVGGEMDYLVSTIVESV